MGIPLAMGDDLRKNLPEIANSAKIINLYPDQDYHQLVKKYTARGELFEDSRFPASNSLLPDKESEIQWIRPHVSCCIKL